MKTFSILLKYRIKLITLALLFVVIHLKAQIIHTEIQSCSFSPSTIDFDIYIKNVTTNSANDFILQGGSYGIDFNFSGISNGGTTSITYIPGTSELSSNQSNFNSINTSVNSFTNSIRINAQVVMSSINGTPMAPNLNIRVGSFRLTNTVNWKADSLINFEWVLALVMNKTRTRFAIYLNGSSLASPVDADSSSVFISLPCQSMVLNPTPFTVLFTQTDSVICKNGCIQFFGNSNYPVTGWNWHFPGGIPDSSNLQNPIICYNQIGTYNASLVATDTSLTSTSSAHNSIIVNSIPIVTLSANDTVCFSGGNVPISGLPVGGNYSGAGVTGNSFNPAIAGIGNHYIYYNFTDTNGCSITDSSLIHVDACTSIDEQNMLTNDMLIYPNPAHNTCLVKANSYQNSTLFLYDLSGRLILSKSFNIKTQLNIEQLKSGIYLIEIKDIKQNSIKGKLVKS